MKATSKQYAEALYEITKEKSDQEIDSAISSFVKDLRKNGKVKDLNEIIARFSEVYNKKNGIIEAEVVSAKELSGDQNSEVKTFIKEKYSAEKVIMNNKVDENIKGGIIIKVGDEIIDGSISNKLNKLKIFLKK